MVPFSSASRNSCVGAREALELGEVLQDLRRAGAGELPLVEALQRELARAAARRDLHPPIALSMFAISTATRAASAPFTAARAFACVLVVRS